jgi:hypothetical protein
MLSKKGLAERALARLESGFQSLGLPMCSSWARDHGLSFDRILQMEMTEPAVELTAGTSLKCCEPDCIHYIYGFSSIQSLQNHLLQQHAQHPYAIQNVRDLSLPPSQSTNLIDLSTELTGTNTGEDPQFIQFDTAPSNKRKQAMPLPRPKRSRATEDDKLNIMVVREVGPCLRCQVLKKRVWDMCCAEVLRLTSKQCDSEEPCNHCPQQVNKAGADFWKVLGCHRRISDIASVFLPGMHSPI